MGQFPATVGKETSELNGRDIPAAFDVTSMPFARLRLRRARDEPRYKPHTIPTFSQHPCQVSPGSLTHRG